MQGRRLPSRLPASRLPAIAPREEQLSPAEVQQSASLANSIATDLPRTRLPPRSRNGCWTCRQRKVKCDEAKPQCNQCVRLGHSCDYSNKVAFKDETRKVVERYIGSRLLRSRTWDPAAPLTAEKDSLVPPEEDVLPPFTSLTNDDDWQRKAEYRPPGTYFVVVNPASFEDSEEYRHGYENRGGRPRAYSIASVQSNHLIDDRRTRLDRPQSIRPGSASQAHVSLESADRSSARPNLIVDSETIVLATFDDPSQRSSPWSLVTPSRFITHELDTPPLQSPALGRFIPSLDDLRASPLTGSATDAAFQDQEDRLLRHYRSYVRRHIVQVHQEIYLHPSGETGRNVDLFELEAITFPPLFHALMALSALSLAHRAGSQNVDALQYYQKALTPLQNMRSEQDLASNGTFLTHFVLLLYEIAAAEPYWSTHLANLDRIAQVRQNVYGSEPFPAVLWRVCIIDIHALLSGCGKGSFIGNMVANSQVPTTSELLQIPGLLEPSARYSHEEDTILPAAVEFHRTISLGAAQLGYLATRLRDEITAQSLEQDEPANAAARLEDWQQQVHDIRESLRETWRMQMPPALIAGYNDNALSSRIQGVFEHTSLTYRTCIIYSYTSMWPTQRIDSDNGYDCEIPQCASEIIEVAAGTVRRQQYEHGFVLFPLFMAGFATVSEIEKAQALNLMRAMEQESSGANKIAIRKLLEAVYERQNERQMTVGHSMDVDWIQVMRDSRLQVVL